MAFCIYYVALFIEYDDSNKYTQIYNFTILTYVQLYIVGRIIARIAVIHYVKRLLLVHFTNAKRDLSN